MPNRDNDKNILLESLNSKIFALEALLEKSNIKSIYLLKIDGRYIENVDMMRYELDADDDKNCFNLCEINTAMYFDKNAAHRTKYFLDFHHDCKFEIVNFHSELLDLIVKKKYLKQGIF